VQQGQTAAGIVQMRQGLDDWRATGMALFRPYFLALLAETLWEKGLVTQGLEVLAEALTLVEETEEMNQSVNIYDQSSS
jgi:hypothetical protein